MLKLRFHGAAGEVTGSCHFLYLDQRLVLLDCGLFQGRRKEAFEKNRQFPVPETDVHSVILSHAHIDHMGNLPTLGRGGFSGPIYATGATAQLARLMLRDSAHIQEHDVRYVNKKRKRQGKKLMEPLYTDEDAQKILEHFIGMPYNRPFHVLRHLKASFHHAGHILGAASVLVECDQDDRTVRLGFSGDIGRTTHPFLREPEPVEDVDYLILESTYGDRHHEKEADLKERILQVANQVLNSRGKLIIPAFSVGRTQLLVYYLNLLWEEGRLPRIPVYVDSPLSTSVTGVFRQRYECCSDELRSVLLKDDDPFGFETLTYVRDTEKSKQLNDAQGPMIIISASGMCEGGRILHHLRNSVSDSRNVILIVGYMAEHTLGRRIREQRDVVKIFGEPHELKAHVEIIDGMSAHGDQDDLLHYAEKAGASGRLKKIFLVHGEREPQAALTSELNKRLPNVEVITPDAGEEFEL